MAHHESAEGYCSLTPAHGMEAADGGGGRAGDGERRDRALQVLSWGVGGPRPRTGR
ncbi:hypothetical protein [Streptomyces sp. NPDC059166]|uniref:hypothetical protein n=1 Tax=Streptomyces sp. NPDC059166 TaxID=3346752 RepID=UPI003689BD10